MSPIQGLLATGGGAKVRAEDLLGFLTMYSVPDRMVEYHEVVQLWSSEKLDVKVMPKPSKPVDVFQLACSAVETRRKRSGANEVVLAERLKLSTDRCDYQITRSVVDSDANRVEHPKAMIVQFTLHGEQIKVTQLEDYGVLAPLEREIKSNYRAFKTQIPGSKVRTGIRETIVGRLGGTNYMGKGIYMVPKKALSVLESMQRVLDSLYGKDAHMSLIPMLDTKINRDDLSRFHADEIKNRTEALMATIADKLEAGGTVRSDMLGNVLDAEAELQNQRDQIVAMLGRETASVDARLKAVATQVAALLKLSANNKRGVTV